MKLMGNAMNSESCQVFPHMANPSCNKRKIWLF